MAPPDDELEHEDADDEDLHPPAELLELFEVLEWDAALAPEAGS